MKSIAIVVLVGCLGVTSFSQNKFSTYFERTNYLETPSYDSTIAFCKHLSKASSLIHYTTFGISPEGRSLPLLIADKDQLTEPKEIRKTGRTILFIQACIHAGESDGKDAGLLLFRDFITKPDIKKLLDSVSVIFIPIYSVDGHERFGPYNRINQNGPKEMGWRTNSQNLNLNRDYIKAEAPETQAWLDLFNEWKPDFFVDCHTTDGADYIYPLTYGIEINGSMDESLTKWQEDQYLPFVKTAMDKANYPIYPYVSFRDWHNIDSGLESWVTPPMLSQGYTALSNCPGLLIETHMLKDYKTRVYSTYAIIQYTMELLNKEGKNLQKLIKKANEYSSSSDFRNKSFPLAFDITHDSVMVEFKGMEYSSEKSDLTGGTWYKFGKKVKNYSIPLFHNIIATAQTQLPEFYIVPVQYSFVKDILRHHQLFFYSLKKDTIINVQGYRFSNVKFSNFPYEGRQKVSSFAMDTLHYSMKILKGTIIVPMSQPKSRIIAHILEPQASSSLLQYGYFNTIFEQKEYGESYVLEGLAREMLKDPTIKEKFEKEVKNNPDFPKDSYAMLNWFYIHSKYKDEKQNLYPIAKSYDNELMRALPLEYYRY